MPAPPFVLATAGRIPAGPREQPRFAAAPGGVPRPQMRLSPPDLEIDPGPPPPPPAPQPPSQPDRPLTPPSVPGEPEQPPDPSPGPGPGEPQPRTPQIRTTSIFAERRTRCPRTPRR